MFIEKLNEEIIKELFLDENREIKSCLLCNLKGKPFWEVEYDITSRNCTYRRFILIITDFEVRIRSIDGLYSGKSSLDIEDTEKLRNYFNTQDETYQSCLSEHLDETTADSNI